jgi:preprotein translocase subunit SecF
MKIPFIKYYKVWISIGAATILLSLVLLISFGLKPGIDFTSGSLMEVSFSQDRPNSEDVQKVLKDPMFKDAVIQKTGDNEILIRTKFLTEDQHQELIKDLRTNFENDKRKLSEEGFETIGPVVSGQLKSRAVWAVTLVSLGIIAYLAYAFRKVSRPIASWKYGIMAIVAMVHDILLVLGVFAVLGHYFGVEIDVAFVVAILTVLGYSVNDTIIVYDRIRENLLHHTGDSFSEIVNNGLNETLMRSINTTLTVLIPLFTLYFFGGLSLKNFTLALLIGMASGAYSSIFIASPLLVLTEKWQDRLKRIK